MRMPFALPRRWRSHSWSTALTARRELDAGSFEHLAGWNIRAVAGARVLLAWSNALVLYLDRSVLPSAAGWPSPRRMGRSRS